MKESDLYSINISSLSSHQTYTFELKFDDCFFKNFPKTEISKANGKCLITCLKEETMITLNLHISGTVDLVCDRTLTDFHHPIEVEKVIIYKFGEEKAELSDEMMLIPRNTEKIDVSNFIYEFISLTVPMKKINPKFAQKSLEEIISSSKDDEKKTKENTDPRWDTLKSLKF